MYSPERVITAYGDNSNSKARVEFYLGGNLKLVFLIPSNQDLMIGDCESGTSLIYYPMKKRVKRKN